MPIRTIDPIGAIGSYWSNEYLPSNDEIRLLQAIADATAVAFENIRLLSSISQK